MNNIKKLQSIFSIISFICSILIGFIALFLPPCGVIDTSVLWFTSQLLLFTASILGLDSYVSLSNKNV